MTKSNMRRLIAPLAWALFLFTPSSLCSDDPLVFLDTSVLAITLSDNYITNATVFLLNNTNSACSIRFVVQAQDRRGPIQFEVSNLDSEPLKPGEVRAFLLSIFTTSKEGQSPDTNLSSLGYLVATVEGNPNIKPAVRQISFYLEPKPLIGHKKFTIPFLLTLFVILIASLRLWRNKRIGLRDLMKEVKFDPKETWLSNFVVGTSVLNVVIGLGTLKENVKVEVTALTGLFVLLILLGPLIYNLTLAPGPKGKNEGENVGRVWIFLMACACTLMGSYGALATAWLVFDSFAQSKLISKSVNMFFLGLLVILICVICSYALSAIYRTVVTQAIDVSGESRKPTSPVRQRASLL